MLFRSLRPGLDAAVAQARGVFVLALTSNPEGAAVQHRGSPSVAARIIAEVGEENRRARAGDNEPGHVGLVIGATRGEALDDLGVLDEVRRSAAIVLAPGVGAQGATPQDLAVAFRGHTDHVLAPVSRGLLGQGFAVREIRGVSTALRDQLGEALR